MLCTMTHVLSVSFGRVASAPMPRRYTARIGALESAASCAHNQTTRDANAQRNRAQRASPLSGFSSSASVCDALSLYNKRRPSNARQPTRAAVYFDFWQRAAKQIDGARRVIAVLRRVDPVEIQGLGSSQIRSGLGGGRAQIRRHFHGCNGV